MIEPVMFTNHHYEKPKDQQVVWLLMKGEKLPRPAMFSLCGKKNSYDLLGGQFHTPKLGDGWATLEPPKNMNCSDG